MLIHEKFHCEGDHNDNKFHKITKQLTQRQSVEFALYCAKDVFHLVKDQHKEVAKFCIDLVEKWLKDENSVTNAELSNAGNAAFRSAASYAAAAYYAAAYAAAYASWSASWFVEITDAAWSAANAAIYAVKAIANYCGYNNKFNEYLVIANSYLTKTNVNCPNYEIEGKILYLIDELEENIIVHKDKYYVNMNGIDKCPEYGFDTQQELLNELLYSEDQFWAFARNWLDQLYKNQQT